MITASCAISTIAKLSRFDSPIAVGARSAGRKGPLGLIPRLARSGMITASCTCWRGLFSI